MDNNLEEKLVSSYVGKKYEKLKNKHFSFLSLFFGWEYLAYRKFYSLLLIYIIPTTILTLVLGTKEYLIVEFIINIILALVFNKLYLNDAVKKVNKIKDSNPNANELELINKCSKKGGGSFIPPAVVLVIRWIILTIIKTII